MRRLPPLNSLRAFEAASRHLSFTEAAKELFVTQDDNTCNRCSDIAARSGVSVMSHESLSRASE